MAQPGQSFDIEEELNRMTPIAKRVQLGTLITIVTTTLSEFNAKWAALLDKIDADTGSTQTDYVSTLAFSTAVPTLNALERAGAGPSLEEKLNKMNPTCFRLQYGALISRAIAAFNRIDTGYNALLAKIDADNGGTETDYASLLSFSTLMPTMDDLRGPITVLDLRDEMNDMSPTANRAELGDVTDEVITLLNKFNIVWPSLLAKIDADVGSLESNYAETLQLIEPPAAIPPTERTYPLTTSLFDSLLAVALDFSRPTDSVIEDHEGVVRFVPAGAIAEYGARVERTLATALTTHTITVVAGADYQVSIKGDAAATAVCSDAFALTLTADGTNRISTPNGAANTAATTSLTVTVTGTLTQLMIEEVSGASVTAPSDYVDFAIDYGAGVNGLRYRDTTNGNTVDGSGLVTEAAGTPVVPSGVAAQGARINLIPYSGEMCNASGWTLTASDTCAPGFGSPTGRATAMRLTESTGTGNHATRSVFSVTAGVEYVFSVYARYANLRKMALGGFGLFGASEQPVYDLQAGTVAKAVAETITKGAWIQSASNGYYRCCARVLPPIDGTVGVYLADDASVSYTGNGAGAVDFYGAMMTLGNGVDYAPPYTETGAASASCASDEYSLATGEPQGDLAVVATYTPGYDSPSVALFGTADARGVAYEVRAVTSGAWGFAAGTGGGEVQILDSALTEGTPTNIGVSLYQETPTHAYVVIAQDGAVKYSALHEMVLDHSGTKIDFGRYETSGASWNGTLKGLYHSVAPIRAAELEALTA